MNNEKKKKSQTFGQGEGIMHVINDMIKERKGFAHLREIFDDIDLNGDGVIDWNEFVSGYQRFHPEMSITQLKTMFVEADIEGDGILDFDEWVRLDKLPKVEVLVKLSVKNRDARGLVQVQASREDFFGQELKRSAQIGLGSVALSQSQYLSMELYESRVASMQRFVSMTVMFHQMGMRVQSFFPKISFGLLGYRMDRTQSNMRIATTASPVSGADVRDRMVERHLRFKIQKAVNLVCRSWKRNKHIEESPYNVRSLADVAMPTDYWSWPDTKSHHPPSQRILSRSSAVHPTLTRLSLLREAQEVEETLSF